MTRAERSRVEPRLQQSGVKPPHSELPTPTIYSRETPRCVSFGAMREQPTRARKMLDLTILAVVMASVIFMAPKLSKLTADFTARFGDDLSPERQAQFKIGLPLFGYMVLAGAATMLAPCHSFFQPPLGVRRRIVLGLLCVLPLCLAVVGRLLGPEELAGKFIPTGLLCSSGVLLFGLPPVLGNCSLFDVLHRIRQRRL